MAEIPLITIASRPVEGRPEGTPRLWGKTRIKVYPGSVAFLAYGKSEVDASFSCNYELNPAYRDKLESTGLRVTGVSGDGGARIIELSDHRFFLGTGFLPQLGSTTVAPDPLIVAYLDAARRVES